MQLSNAVFITLSSMAAGQKAESDIPPHGARRLRGAGNSDEARDNGNSPQNNSANNELQTNGVCWTHSEGSICQDDDSFKGVSMLGDEILIQEFVGDGNKMYSYKIRNEKKFHEDFDKVPSDVANKKLAHVLAKLHNRKPVKVVKYGCKVEVVGEFSINPSNKELLPTTNTDGTTQWSVNNWTVTADSKMNPISIAIPNEEGEFSTSITSVERFSKGDLEGCDPETEGDEYPEATTEEIAVYFEFVNAYNPSISDDEFISGVGHRHLDWLTDFTASVSNTQWCGPGTPSNTPCPNKDGPFDFEADNACRRHDHGKKIEYTSIGLPRLECAVDNDLNSATDNWAVTAVYGTLGGTSLPGFGCKNYQSYNCWRWSGWYPTFGHCGWEWATRIGPWRYDGARKQSGYNVRSSVCSEDYRLTYWPY